MQKAVVVFVPLLLLLLVSCAERTVQVGDRVGVVYTASLADGTLFEQSEQPIYFNVGSTDARPIFDNAVRGMKIDEGKQITIPPSKAYGEYDRAKVATVPRSQFPSNQTLNLGMILTLQSKDGSTTEATIVDLNEQNITLDFNHPLAGETLIFKIVVVSIE